MSKKIRVQDIKVGDFIVIKHKEKVLFEFRVGNNIFLKHFVYVYNELMQDMDIYLNNPKTEKWI